MADHRPGQEFYDLEKDPWETKNLAYDPEYADVKKRLEEALYDWMIETRDTGLLPEPYMKRMAIKYGSEYAILHRMGGEKRAKKLLQLAIITSEPKTSDKEVLYKALKSDDAAERYWAVVALGLLTPSSDIEKLQRSSRDDEASVRIASAQSLYWAGQKEESVGLLEKELKKTEELDESLHYALNVLEEIGDDAKPAIPAVKKLQAAKRKSEYVKRLAKRLIGKFQAQ
jgi:hypothetical protein